MSQIEVFRYARLAAKAADEKLGENILVFDVRKASTLADCFLLVSGSSHIHIRAIEDSVREVLRDAGASLRRTDGQRGHLWRALDYGNLIIHIMDQKTRDFYAMERLWERGKLIEWADAKPKRKPAKKKSGSKRKKVR